jgi:cytoskeletal protein CcmA (bactofilin family)
MKSRLSDSMTKWWLHFFTKWFALEIEKIMWSKEKKIQEEINLAHATSVFAKGLDIVGDIEAKSDLRIEGDIQGNVTTKKKLIIGTSGKVLGNISAGELCVMGEVTGEMFIERFGQIHGYSES